MLFMACGNKTGKTVSDTDSLAVDSINGPVVDKHSEITGSKDSTEVDLLDIDEMPKTTVRQPDAHFQHAVYVNIDKPASGEGEMDAVYSVWLADERTGTVIKVCVTNPMAEAQWQKMNGKDADAVDVPITQIASAEKAYIAPGDVSKVIVEGCPDGRNMWTYIIDPYKGTAKQLPSTEGVVTLEWEKKEIIASSYGYDDDGRYSVKKAYSLEGQFLRIVGDKDMVILIFRDPVAKLCAIHEIKYFFDRKSCPQFLFQSPGDS